MYSICVKGKVFRPLVVTENHVILNYQIDNYSNVIFPKKEISIVLNLREANISLDNALDMVEKTIGKDMELYLQFPKIGPIYRVDMQESKLF
jgi:hypothetical protein